MWVQLNFGDTALKRMFKKIFMQLKPGGRFLLEPQVISSYKKKKNLSVSGCTTLCAVFFLFILYIYIFDAFL